jgi:HD superfamily phosphohydrolase
MGVHDKNLGMEKLDYLERDGMVTVLSRPPGVEYLRKHIYFMDGGLVIDEKVVDNAIELQNFYLKMYKNVYLRKASAIAQGMLQKMTHLMLKNGTITQEALPKFTDSELLGLLAASNDPEVATLYALFRARELFQEAIAVRPSRFAETYSVAGKPIAVFGLDDAELLRIASSPALQMNNQESLRELESAIAETAGIPATHLLIVPLSQSYRFEIKDVRIYSETNGFSSLKERYPAHFKNSEEVATSYTTFRICTTEKYRKLLSEPERAKAVLELIKKKAL